MSSQVAGPQPSTRPAASNGANRRRGERDGSAGPSRSDSSNWRAMGGQNARSGGGGGGAGGSQTSGPPSSSASSSSGLSGSGLGRGGPSGVGAGSGSGGGAPDRTYAKPGDGSGKGEPLGAFTDRPLHDRFVLLVTSLIGLPVEVQVRNGSVYTGIFHSAHEKDLGVVLRMARMIKDGSKSGLAAKEASRKPPTKSFVIQPKDCVQIIAKDVTLAGEQLANGKLRDNKGEIVTDSGISRGVRPIEGRELKPWRPEPGEEPSRNLRLENTFSGGGAWGRNWDQFEANKVLFGVGTTFDENLYTTKLERPSKEQEREALRIAREIESQGSRNSHQLEERGLALPADVEAMDEETRFSSVIRGVHGDEDDGVGEDEHDHDVDERNDDTFGPSTPDRSPSGSEATHEASSASQAEEAEGGAKGSMDRAQASTSGAANGGLPRKEGPSTPTTPGQDRKPWGGPEPQPSIDQEELSALDAAAEFTKGHLRLRLAPKRSNGSLAKATGGSPYHSPVGRYSPLLSPLVSDAASLQALNLDPSCPQVPDEVYREFAEFKLAETAKKGKKGREDQVNELKSFSESLRERTPIEPRSPLAPRQSSGQDTPPAGSRRVPSDLAVRTPASPDAHSRASPFAASRPGASATPSPASTPTPSPGPSAFSSQSDSASDTGAPAKPDSGPSAGPAAGAAREPHQTAGPASAKPGAPAGKEGAAAGAPAGSEAAGAAVASSRAGTAAAAPAGSGARPSTPSSSASTPATPAKKSTLNPNAKEFKLNPNAKVFTPGAASTPPAASASASASASPAASPAPVPGGGGMGGPHRPHNPTLVTGPMYMPAGAMAQGVMPQGMALQGMAGQYMPQGGPGQFPGQYNAAMAAAAYMQQGGPPGAFGVPGGMPGAVLPGQPGMKLPPHSQQPVAPIYGQHQGMRGYPPQGPPMQAGPYVYPNSPQYPQGVVYGPQGQMLYMHPIPQMMQGQPMPPPQQGGPPGPHQGGPQGPKHRGGGPMPVQYQGPGGAPPFLPGQQHPGMGHPHGPHHPPPPGGPIPGQMGGPQGPPPGGPSGGGGGRAGGNKSVGSN